MLRRLTQGNAREEDTEERRDPSMGYSKNSKNFMRVQNVLISNNFIVLNVVSQIGDGTGSTRPIFVILDTIHLIECTFAKNLFLDLGSM